MSRTRAIIVIAALALVAWVLPGALHALLVWWGPPPADGPGPLAPLLPFVPETIPVWAWHAVPPWPVVLIGASALTLVAVAAIGAMVVDGRAGKLGARPRWQLAIALWIAVAVAGVLVLGVQAVATLVDDAPYIRLTYVAERGGAAIAQGLLWGVLWGWIPGVVVSRLRRPEQQRGRRGPLAAVIALALAGASVIVLGTPAATDANYAATGQYTTNGVHPAPIAPTPTPTPPPEVAPDAVAADPSWCTSAQLSFEGGGADAATGHRAAGILARNVGAEPCVLNGYPDLAFADPTGNAVAVTLATGGGFMTEDPGPSAIELAPGAAAVAYASWDATDGRTVLSTVYVAPYPGDRRAIVTVSPAWDLTDQSEVTVTAWQTPPATDPFTD